MTARAGAPPGKRTGPPGQGAGTVEMGRANGLTVTVDETPDTAREPVHVSQCVAEFVDKLLDLGRRHGDIPVYGSAEWAALEPMDPRRFASVARAAEAWRREGTDDAIRERMLDEFAVADLLARWRIRMAGLDIREAIEDWPRVYDVVQARAAYRERWGVSA